MKIVGLVLVIAMVSCLKFREVENEITKEQIAFINKCKPDYESLIEFQFRTEVFEDKLETIQALNDAKTDAAVYGTNCLSDLTNKELSGLLGIIPPSGESYAKREFAKVEQTLPATLNWTNGWTTPVKNQGSCGSCWAFCATTVMESRWKIKKNSKTTAVSLLSEQELVDCSGSYGNYGCNGGWPSNGWRYSKAKKGLRTSTQYTYKAVTQSCQRTSSQTGLYPPVTASVSAAATVTAVKSLL